MSSLFRLLLDIALLKKGPQDVPYSPFLFFVLFAVLAILGLVILQIPGPDGQGYDVITSLRYILIANALIFSGLYLIFYLNRLANRFLQTITALTGTDLLFAFIQLPIHYFIVQALIQDDKGSIAILGLFQMILFGWGLIVSYHIFRQAMSSGMLYPVVLTVGIFSLSLFLRGLLLPELGS